MKKLTMLALTLVLVLCVGSALAETNPFIVTGGNSSDDWAWDESKNILTIKASGLTVSNANPTVAANATIVVDNVDVTLENVNIENTQQYGNALTAKNSKLTFEGVNTLKALEGNAVVLKKCEIAGNPTRLDISGGCVTVYSRMQGYNGIQAEGNLIISACNVTIDGGDVVNKDNLEGNMVAGEGIMVDDGDLLLSGRNITINGGDASNKNEADNARAAQGVSVDGGSVTITGSNVTIGGGNASNTGSLTTSNTAGAGVETTDGALTIEGDNVNLTGGNASGGPKTNSGASGAIVSGDTVITSPYVTIKGGRDDRVASAITFVDSNGQLVVKGVTVQQSPDGGMITTVPPKQPAAPAVPAPSLPKTGDPSHLMAWFALLGASGLGMLKTRKKK